MDRYKIMFEAAPLAIVVIDQFGIIEEVNPGTLKLLGYDPPDLVGHNISMIIPEPHRSHHDEYIANYIKTRNARIIGIGREVPALRKDGTEMAAFLSVSDYIGVDGKLRFVGFVKDISDRVEAETRLRVSERLASVGEMSSSIAHEIANPLTVIIGAAESLSKQTDSSKETPTTIKDSVGRILRMTERIKTITNNVRKFARDASTDPMTEVAVADLFSSVRELCAHRAERAQVQFKIVSPPEGLSVRARETQICQALVNLINNGVDAASQSKEKWVCLVVEVKNDRIYFRITDSGDGVAQEVRNRLGQKLVTTKPAGKGTGLGLYLARRNIESHAGRIFVDDEAPSTSFVVELPHSDKIPRAS